MSVLDELQATVATQRAVLSALEPGCLSGPDALRLLEVFTEIERLGAAGRMLMAKRVEASNVWRQSASAAPHTSSRTRPARAWGAPRRRWRRPSAWHSCPPPRRRS